MARREYRVRVTCAHPAGCLESTTYYLGTRAEEAETRKWQHDHPWKCTRHEDPGGNLRPGNESTRLVLVATRLLAKRTPGFPDNGPEWLPGLFWIPEDGKSGSGFTHGPGFTAHAVDFPEGTRLVVTAQVELPAQETAGA